MLHETNHDLLKGVCAFCHPPNIGALVIRIGFTGGGGLL